MTRDKTHEKEQHHKDKYVNAQCVRSWEVPGRDQKRKRARDWPAILGIKVKGGLSVEVAFEWRSEGGMSQPRKES